MNKIYIKVGKETLALFPDCTAFRRRRLLWDPHAFVTESPRREPKTIEASVQDRSLEKFIANPRVPMTYVIAGTPDDEKAKYFAAHLVEIHCSRLGVNASPHWEPVFNGYDNLLIKRELSPSILVLSNLSTKSNYLKYDKARDCIERFSSVPKIVVVAGEDPISFAQTRLHVPCHGLAYFANSSVKSVNEII
jgi:hypothetical protein